MHTLTIFPSLLTFGLISPFILRLAVALFVFSLGKNRYKKEYKWSSVFYIASAVLVFIGLYTQIAVLIAIVVLKFDFYLEYWKNRTFTPISKETYFLYSLAIIILLSLLFTGPGFLAFDLPL